jgi:pimeloyl-ACP methyl ester carboxylesterase
VQLFLDEVSGGARRAGLDRIHLLGQSWGGMLAFEYMLTRPEGVASLIICDSLSSVPLWIAEADRLRTLLPEGVQETLLAHERAGRRRATSTRPLASVTRTSTSAGCGPIRTTWRGRSTSCRTRST